MKRIPPQKEGIGMADYKPRKYPQLVLPMSAIPNDVDLEAGETVLIELEVKVWECDEHEDAKDGKVSCDILAVHGVETEDEENSEDEED